MSGKPQPGNVAWPAQDRKIGLGQERVGSRKLTVYDPHIALQIIELVADGQTLKEICTADNEMPSKNTFLNWVSREPELKNAYMAAREISALSFEEEAIDIARKSHQSPGTTQKVRAAEIVINQLRWSAARRDPRSYGDKAQTAIVVPVNIQTSLDLGTGVSPDGTDGPDIYTLTLKPSVVEAGPTGDFIPEKDPHAPRKRVLIPHIPMDAETPLKEREPDGRANNGR